MKILHLTSQDTGGAGRAAIRLHESLLENNIDSSILTQDSFDNKPKIKSITQSKIDRFFLIFRIALQYFPLLFYPKRKKDIFSGYVFYSNKKLIQKIKEINPDIIHLHWINSGFISHKDLLKFNKPIIWSLHDANPYTGGCHYTEKCQKFHRHCFACPKLETKAKYDLSYLTFRKKISIYSKINLTINGLSKWIANESKQSFLFKNNHIVNLPNPINTNVFKPIDINIATNILNLTNQNNKITIGFGAINSTKDRRKGYKQLKEALEFLPNKEKYRLLVFGSNDGENIAGIETRFLGHLHDDTTIMLFFNAINFFIMPSLSENLSNTIMESLACGTPVVAFDIGGNSDMIIHKFNGYLATDSKDMADGILWVTQNNLENLSKNSRNFIVKNFNYNKISKEYIKLYQSLL